MPDLLQAVYPGLATLIRQLTQNLAGEQINIRVTQGLRPWEVQAELYEQGRTKPGKIVTYARAGHSWHNFGLAVDVAPFDAEGRPDWDTSHPAWKRIVDAGTAVGLVAGGLWEGKKRDNPHLQYTGRFGVSPDDEVRVILASQGLAGVWREAFKQV